MRMMLKASLANEPGNKGIKDGSLPKTMMSMVEQLKPESAYFTCENGLRTAFFIFDMKDASQMPPVAEPFFMIGASVTMTPVMNQDDLKKGLEAVAKKL